MATPYKANGISMTLMDEYEEDKKHLDRYIEGTPDNQSRYNKVEEVVNKDPGHVVSKDPAGNEEFDIDEAVLNFPDDKNIAGVEDFVTFAKQSIARLLRLIKNAIIYVYELVFNKVSKLRRAVRVAESQLRQKTLIPHAMNYPVSVRKCFSSLQLPSNPAWVLKSLQDVQLFYTRLMKAHGELLDHAKSEQWKHDSDYIFTTASDFANTLCQDHHQDYSESKLLPGGKVFKVVYSKGTGSNRPTVSISQRLSLSINDKSFLPDRSLCDDIVTGLSGFSEKIKNDHRSQSSASRKMESRIKELERRPMEQDTQRKAAAYFSWLIEFQRKVLSTGLQYIFGVLFGMINFVESQVK